FAKGLIEPSQSPWASNIVIVKKNGEDRYCYDYRPLNEVSIKDSFRLPNIEETLEKLQGATFISVMDLFSGFWQIPMAPEDKEKTAFICPQGLWQYKAMPFGLSNAPATFQRAMEHVLASCLGKFAFVFIDDVCCASQTFEEHLQHLQMIFDRLIECRLYLKPAKCEFCRREVKYLGHIVSATGIRPDPDKVEKIRNFPVPREVRELQSFLGMVNYYHRFLINYSDRAKPLYLLIRKKQPWIWEEAQQKAFEDLKNALLTEALLYHPDFSKEFIIHTDASNSGLGAILHQEHLTADGEVEERPVAFASRALTPSEVNYSATQLEAMAVVWAVNKFKPFVYGYHFTVVTDHNPHQYLNTA